MWAASAASRRLRSPSETPRRIVLTPTRTPLGRSEIAERALELLAVGVVRAGAQRDERAEALAARVAQRAGREPAQPRLGALGDRRPRPRVAVALHGLDVEHEVAAGEVAAGGAGARLGDVGRPALERLEEVADDVLGSQALDQLGLVERDGELVGDRAQQLVGLLAERRARPGRDERAEVLVARGDRRDERRAARGRRRPAAAEHVEQDRGALGPAPGRAPPRRVGRRELEAAGRAVEEVELAGVAAQHVADALGDDAVQLLAAVRRRRWTATGWTAA